MLVCLRNAEHADKNIRRFPLVVLGAKARAALFYRAGKAQELCERHGAEHALKQGKIVICPPCTDAIREFASYCWDLSAGDRDRVRKEFDHAMDEIRYFVATVVAPEEGEDLFFAGYVERHV